MWFWLAFISMFLYGLQKFLLKVAEERKCDKEITVIFFFLTVGFIALLGFLFFDSSVFNLAFLVTLGVLQASFALMSYILRLQSLEKIPSISAFPLFGLSTFFAALLGISLLGETVGWAHGLGILFSVAAILVLMSEYHFRLKEGVLLALLSSVAMAGSSLFLKVASPHVNLLLFIALSSFYAVIPLYSLEATSKSSAGSRGSRRGAVKIGVLIGAVNFTGLYAMLSALSIADASQVFPLKGLSVVIGIILSEAVYRERITWSRAVSAFLVVMAIVLLGASA